ncbi:MAG: 30S ribosomal protein S14, partial [Candidatus Bathyarchaeota archaeon]|nr:30S ribosomal protein S14 [Candidatus Bathyarchaeota archaeon]
MSEQKKRTTGAGTRRCIRCGNHNGLIRRYGLNICRRCFRETAASLGFT